MTQQEEEINEAEDMDEETLIYLKSFGKENKKPHKTFREVAQAVLFTQTLRKALQGSGNFHAQATIRNSNYVMNATDGLLKALDVIDSYNDFDIFAVHAESGCSSPLSLPTAPASAPSPRPGLDPACYDSGA